jgi:hypothetical protein
MLGLSVLAAPGRPAAAQDEVFKWTDENGQIHFSNSAPAAGANATSRTFAAHRSINQAEADRNTFQAVPLEVSNDQKIVRAHLEGNEEALDVRMIVDTGAQKTMIAPELADQLGVRQLREEVVGGVTGVASMSIVELHAVRIGSEELRDVEVAVGPVPGLSLLGMDVLGRLELRVGRDTLDRERP